MSDKEKKQSNTSKLKIIFVICIICLGIVNTFYQLKSKNLGIKFMGIRGLIAIIGLILLFLFVIYLHFFRYGYKV